MSSSLCAHDDMNIFQPILLFDSFILPAEIIFHYFPQSIKSVTFDIAHTECQSCCKLCTVTSQNAMIAISKTFRKIHVVSYMLNKVWFYCGAFRFSHSGESPLGCFPSWLAERPQSLSYPQSEVHALLDKKMNATAMGSIIINEK